MTDCTVLILTYKGKHHLEHLLPTVKAAIEHSPSYSIDVLIVDNGKDEPTRDYVLQNFPNYHFEFSPVNDYLFSLNPFIQKLNSKYVMILNDDLRLDEDVFNQSIPIIDANKLIFAISAKIFNWDGNGVQNGIRRFNISKGWATNYWEFNDSTEMHYTFYASGGAALFDVKKIQQLNGFDPIFKPAYIEEVDLSHRAWKNGWPVIYNPNFIVYHRDAATISSQFKTDEIAQFFYKNFFLWQYKNIGELSYSINFYFRLPFRMIYWYFKSKNLFWGYLKFIGVKEKKRDVLKDITLTNNDISKKIGQVYNNI